MAERADIQLSAADQHRFTHYIRANVAVTNSCAAGLVIIYAAGLRSGWFLADCAIVLGVSGALVVARHQLRYWRVTRALTIVTVANWSAALATTAITPFVLPVTTPVVLLPVVVMVPYLPRRLLARAIAGAIVVALGITVLARAQFVDGPQQDAPVWLTDAIVIVLVPVVIGLLALSAWQNHLGMSAQAAELSRSRARLVAATDDERRRIERDLHDGAQQHLAAIAIKLGLVSRLVVKEPQRATSLVDQLTSELQQTITGLRDLAHGIYPPLLGQRGLGEALTAAALRSPLPATATFESVGRYPPAIEAAVYFCCLEAMHNAVKHAGPSDIMITMSGEEALTFAVTDDGNGFDPSRGGDGSGLANMSDRIGAVGGHLTIDAAPGRGTTIGGTIPAAAIRASSRP